MAREIEAPPKIGLDHLAVYSPNQYLPLERLAEARNVDPQKFTIRLGIKEMSIASPGDDVVTMGANAGYRVIKEAGISPEDIGMLIVGTESSEDKAKPAAIFVHDLLEISNSCRVYDIIHACAAGTYGVLAAIDWLQNPKNRYALVIASDIARYDRETLAEPTQGAGAVAMLISKNPRLMIIEELAKYSKNVYDFWKPIDRKYPMVKGAYSIQCYMEAAKKCFNKININKKSAFIYHTPFPKLVQHAHELVSKMIDQDMDWKYHYDEKVADSIIFPARMGNIYAGSSWLGLYSLIENYYRKNANMPNRTDEIASKYDGCYIFSYGSGCGSVLIRGEFIETSSIMAENFTLKEELDNRTLLSVEEYEALNYSPEKMRDNNYNSGLFKFVGIQNYERQYLKLC
jgi:hydroxymethylglutaryl-CoA synthase